MHLKQIALIYIITAKHKPGSYNTNCVIFGYWVKTHVHHCFCTHCVEINGLINPTEHIKPLLVNTNIISLTSKDV